jgi:predicted transcriptional regulator
MKSADIAKKLGRRVDSVSHVLSKLVEAEAVVSPSRGVFAVAEGVVK